MARCYPGGGEHRPVLPGPDPTPVQHRPHIPAVGQGPKSGWSPSAQSVQPPRCVLSSVCRDIPRVGDTRLTPGQPAATRPKSGRFACSICRSSKRWPTTPQAVGCPVLGGPRPRTFLLPLTRNQMSFPRQHLIVPHGGGTRPRLLSRFLVTHT